MKPNFTRGERSRHLHRARGDFRYFDAVAVGDTGRSRARARHAAAGELKRDRESRAGSCWRCCSPGSAPAAHAQIPLPQLEARVTDLTGTLTAAQQSALEEKLAAFEARKGAQIAVLILPTTEPEDIAQFGIRLAEAWKLGRKGVDDGAILIVAKDDRAMRIEVQYGLEGVLTDATASRIINDTIVPLFKQGDFYGGINAGVDQMLRVVDGEPLAGAGPGLEARTTATDRPGRCCCSASS